MMGAKKWVKKGEMAAMIGAKKGEMTAKMGAKEGERAATMKGTTSSMAVVKTIGMMRVETPIRTCEMMRKFIDERGV